MTFPILQAREASIGHSSEGSTAVCTQLAGWEDMPMAAHVRRAVAAISSSMLALAVLVECALEGAKRWA